ncbi:Tryptophan synthase alpha chain [Planctomycetes bacterium Pan216]|uniref:Tryptophan synthase alpha chain n=1 Tax=Kolteria novifilia TaxID=2527975 RepID=A0A518B0R5_9BACT|nr:Tryptophan synthase alpha chain [Planctomycetes bacterium Pan216]
MKRIAALFAETRRDGQAVFVPFLAAGDPDVPTATSIAKNVIETCESKGVPVLLEIGFPYSDPIADGATIQAAYTRALNRDLHIDDVLETISTLRASTEAPIVGMVSYSLVHRNGGTTFLSRIQQAGGDGAIIPDLPVEEAEEVWRFGKENDFAIVQLIAPTTPLERAKRILEHASGFVYVLSVAGITGERAQLPEDLAQRIETLRSHTDLPICIGFGISSPDQVAHVGGIADGVIVGSAIVRQVANVAPGDAEGVTSVAGFVSELVAPLAST